MTAVRTSQPLAGVQSAQGMDVSNYQGAYNWAVPAGLSFGAYRVTQGLGGGGTNSPDPQARWNHAQIRDHGLHRIPYHFLDPHLPGDRQADYFLAELGHLGIVDSDVLACDNETAGASPAQVADCAGLFMETIVKLRPHNPRLVYTFIDFAKTGNCNGLEHYPLWLAYPAATAPLPPPPWVRWQFWQWGLRNGVDADAFNGTAASLDAWVASFQPPPVLAGPPYRHLTVPGDTIAALAASRNSTTAGFLARSAAVYTPADLAVLGAAELPAGLAWYSEFP